MHSGYMRLSEPDLLFPSLHGRFYKQTSFLQACSTSAMLSSLHRVHRYSLRMKGGLVIHKLMRGMLGKFLSSSTRYDLISALDQDMGEDEGALPVDVKEGQFAVYTVDDGSLRRSVVELSYLTHPGFLMLLEQAEDEFGFGQMGILVIPCTYNRLQTVIGRN